MIALLRFYEENDIITPTEWLINKPLEKAVILAIQDKIEKLREKKEYWDYSEFDKIIELTILEFGYEILEFTVQTHKYY